MRTYVTKETVRWMEWQRDRGEDEQQILMERSHWTWPLGRKEVEALKLSAVETKKRNALLAEPKT